MIGMYNKRTMHKLKLIYVVLVVSLLGGFSMGGLAAEAPRIVTLGGAVTETALLLGAGDRVVAVDESSVVPEGMEVARVGYYRMISAEGVLSVRPSLVVGTEDAGPPHVLAQLRGAGVRVELLTAEKSLAGAAARIRALGALLGAEEAAAALAEPLEARVAEAPERLAGDPSVLFLYARGAGVPNVSGEGTGADEMIRMAGGRNAVRGFRGYRALTPEALVTAQPEVVLVTEKGLAAMGGEAGVWSLPGMGTTPAGRARRLVVMEDVLLLGFGPRAGEAVDGLRALLEGGE